MPARVLLEIKLQNREPTRRLARLASFSLLLCSISPQVKFGTKLNARKSQFNVSLSVQRHIESKKVIRSCTRGGVPLSFGWFTYNRRSLVRRSVGRKNRTTLRHNPERSLLTPVSFLLFGGGRGGGSEVEVSQKVERSVSLKSSLSLCHRNRRGIFCFVF